MRKAMCAGARYSLQRPRPGRMYVWYVAVGATYAYAFRDVCTLQLLAVCSTGVRLAALQLG